MHLRAILVHFAVHHSDDMVVCRGIEFPAEDAVRVIVIVACGGDEHCLFRIRRGHGLLPCRIVAAYGKIDDIRAVHEREIHPFRHIVGIKIVALPGVILTRFYRYDLDVIGKAEGTDEQGDYARDVRAMIVFARAVAHIRRVVQGVAGDDVAGLCQKDVFRRARAEDLVSRLHTGVYDRDDDGVALQRRGVRACKKLADEQHGFRDAQKVCDGILRVAAHRFEIALRKGERDPALRRVRNPCGNKDKTENKIKRQSRTHDECGDHHCALSCVRAADHIHFTVPSGKMVPQRPSFFTLPSPPSKGVAAS